MKLLLLTGGAKAETGDLTVYWDLNDVPSGQFSAPGMVHEKLLRIRGEHAAWACQTGLFMIGKASVADHLTCGAALSMWWTSLIYERHPKMTPALYEIYKLRALEIFCEERGVREIELIGGDGNLERTLACFCENTGRSFSRRPGERSKKTMSLAQRIYHSMPAPLRALGRYCFWLFGIKRKLPYRGRQPASGKSRALIATYFPNIDLHEAGLGNFVSRYWESLHEILRDMAKKNGEQFVNWLFIRFPQPGLSFSQCLKLRDTFRKHARDGASFNYLEEFLTTSDLWGALSRWLKLCLKSAVIEKRAAREFHFADSEMNFWEYARADWAESFRGWRCLERCLQNLAFLRHAREAGPMLFNLFPLENCPWERMLTVAARQIPGNGAVLGAQHSSLRPTDFRYFDDPATFSLPQCAVFQPDLICANGKSAMSQWLDFGTPKERLRRVEALRYLYLGGKNSGQTSRLSQLPPDPGEPLEAWEGKKLLVLASFFAGETDELCEIVAQAFKSGLLKDFSVTIKPHPWLPVRDRLERLMDQDFGKLRFAEGALSAELVPGVAVLAANSTTASVEAAVLGLPLMVMQAADDFDLCPIQNVAALPRILTIGDLGKALSALAPVDLPPGYFDLDAALPSWRGILMRYVANRN